MLSSLQHFCLDAMNLPHGIVYKPTYAFIEAKQPRKKAATAELKKAQDIPVSRPKKAPSIHTPQTIKVEVKKSTATPIDLSNVNDWAGLEKHIQTCQRCEELTQSRSQVITGYGNTQAELLVIEEAPSSDEDIQGKPFVGDCGKLYDNMLKAIQLDRKSIYTSNVIKCLPPHNRDPHAEEAQNCLSFLDAQIDLIKPKLILALGRIAAHHLLSVKTPVGQLRNTLHTHSNSDTNVIVSYHPAYLMRNPRYKQQAWEDLKQVHSQLHS